MKKTVLFALAVSVIAGMSSCNSEKNTVQTMTYNIPTYNLITSVDGTAAPSVAQSVYKINFDLIAATASVATEINVGSTPISFVTDPIKYTGGMYEWQNAYHEIIKISTIKDNNIYDLNCLISSMAYFPAALTGLPAITYPSGSKYLIMSYNVGSNTLVRTFWPDATFSGNTTTTYSDRTGTPKQFTSKEILYRVVMNITDKKATVILYDAKFAEEMPKALDAIILKDLPLTFTNSGYRIDATNVIPEQWEGGTTTPNTTYVFDSFSLNVGGDLTTTIIEYSVMHNAFHGYFEGKCINQLPSSSGL